TIASQVQADVERQSDELTARSHVVIRRTWFLISLGVVISLAVASYLLHVDVVRELWSVRDSIQSLAAGKLETEIPFAHRPNEIGEIGRSLTTLQQGARERETQSWLKSETANTALRLQSADDFSAFSSSLLSRVSECIPLLYGCFYLADDSTPVHLRRVGTYATDASDQPAYYQLGEGLVGQSALERRTITITPNENTSLQV